IAPSGARADKLPTWAVAAGELSHCCCWTLVTCAAPRIGSPRTATAAVISNQFEICLRIRLLSFLEVEVPAQHKATGGQVRPRYRRRPSLTEPRILVVEGEAGARIHDWVVAEPDGVHVDVAQAGRQR